MGVRVTVRTALPDFLLARSVPTGPNRLCRAGTVFAGCDRCHNGTIDKKNRPSRPVHCLLISPPIVAGGLAAVNRLDPDPDHTRFKGNSCTLTLGKAKQRNRQTDERIGIVHLLHLVRAAVTNLGSGSPTFAGSIVAKDL